MAGLKPKLTRGRIQPLVTSSKATLGKLKLPIHPITNVTKMRMELKWNMANVRNTFFMAWLFVGPVIIGIRCGEIYESWKKEESHITEYIEWKKSEKGEDYFLRTSNKIDLVRYSLINENKEMTLNVYLRHRYSNFTYSNRYKTVDITVFSVGTLLFLKFFLIVVLMKKRAPLVFDRDRQLVYSWWRGKVIAQRFEDITYAYTVQVIDINTLMLDKKGGLKKKAYTLQPSGFAFYSGKKLNEKLLETIANFMAFGRDAVFKEDWQGRDNFYFRKDKMPDDFDEQLDELLNQIEKIKLENPGQYELLVY